MLIFEQDVPRKYDMLSSIHAWIYPDVQPVPEQTGDNWFTRLYPFNDEYVPVNIQQPLLGESLKVECAAKDVDEDLIREMVIRNLGLEHSFKSALRTMRNDKMIANLASGVVGILPYQSPTVFEALIKTVIQQQISYKAANVITRRMVIALSNKVQFQEKIVYSFPTAQDILSAGESELRSFGLGYKAPYVLNIAHIVEQGDVDLEKLRGVPHEDVMKILKPIRGIGSWTVRTLAIAGLGDLSTFPFGDLAVRNLMGRIFNKGKRMSSAEVYEKAQVWGKNWSHVVYLLMAADILGLMGAEAQQQTHKRRDHKEAD